MKYPSHLGRARRRRLNALLSMNDSLRYFSSYIPGGLGTMVALARLSTNESVRRLAVAWNSMPRKEHRTVNLDRLCASADVAPSEFLGGVAEVAYELGMDVSQLMASLTSFSGAVRAGLERLRKGGWRERE